MKMFRLASLFALLLVATPAVAQWQTPNHSLPIGRGAGKTGFGAAVPGTVGIPAVSMGAAVDPAFAPAQNAGIAPGAANTLKGSLNGTTTSDIAVPDCQGIGQAIRWVLGVGPNCGTVVATGGFDMPVNMGLSASVAASSLTLNVTQANGSAPTVSSPVIVPFRSTTATNGTVVLGTISSALSINIPAGATLGTSSSNVPFRIWIFADYNSGTPAIGVATCSNTTTIFPCTAWETTLKTSISPVGNSGGTLYATAGVSNDAVRIIGYCDYATGLVTAGSWLSSCTTLQVMGPGVKKPGDTVQTVYASTTTATSSASTTKLATELAGTITPTSAVNLVTVHAVGSLKLPSGGTGNQACYSQIWRNTGTTAVGNIAVVLLQVASDIVNPAPNFAFDAPKVATSTQYAVYMNLGTGSNTCTYLVQSGDGIPANTGTMTINELMG